MERSNMKATDLMIGDWVYLCHNDDWDTKIAGKVSLLSCGNSEFNEFPRVEKKAVGRIQLEAEDGVQFWLMDEGRIFEPIPLTPEILEKNGFTKYDVGHKVSGWSIMDDDNLYSAIPFTLTDDDFDTELRDYKWGPVEDDREESFVREMGRIHYVHELQHLLRLCRIEKEIVL